MGAAAQGVTMGPASSGSARPHRFGKTMRLRKRREFLAVQRTGKKFHGRHFLVVIALGASTEPNVETGRVGVTVTKKIGNAVSRNRIKRLVREYVRQSAWALPGMDAVIIAKRSAAELDGYAAVAADLSRLKARMSAQPEAMLEVSTGGQ